MHKLTELKLDIFERVKEYFKLKEETLGKPFESGVSKINYAGRVFNHEEMITLVDASLDFWLTSGAYTEDFENEFSRFLGVTNSLFVNSGSSANLLAFSALTSPLLKDKRIKRGDEIITVACCFPTTIAPIIQYGAVPVFVDIDLDTINIDVTLLEQARSPKTKAVMLAHTLGNPFNIKAVKEFCDKYNLFLIEDNCDSLGSKYNGQYTGTFGDIGTSSFYPPHHMTTGEGGMVYTNNPLLYKIMLSMRDWGRDCSCPSGMDNLCKNRFTKQYGKLPVGYDHKYVYSHFGFNLKATDLQAAIGCAQLKKLDSFIKARISNHSKLAEGLSGVDLQKATDNSTPSWFGLFITLPDSFPVIRDQVTNFLEQRKIQTRTLFAGNIIMQPCFDSLVEGVDYRIASPLINTDKIMKNGFWVGVYPGLGDTHIKYMIDNIKRGLSY